ncbi:hypothetical protein RRG08_037190 [Elysia crispata]|uniref:Uncharacterized protein n=1 Tax=Elysia crispata TaxID=231223 RepID=A0AAE0Z3H0_9GAST|nr:hypothetical protein RRG08_037190 [Elysia crispata]
MSIDKRSLPVDINVNRHHGYDKNIDGWPGFKRQSSKHRNDNAKLITGNHRKWQVKPRASEQSSHSNRSCITSINNSNNNNNNSNSNTNNNDFNKTSHCTNKRSKQWSPTWNRFDMSIDSNVDRVLYCTVFDCEQQSVSTIKGRNPDCSCGTRGNNCLSYGRGLPVALRERQVTVCSSLNKNKFTEQQDSQFIEQQDSQFTEQQDSQFPSKISFLYFDLDNFPLDALDPPHCIPQ